MSTRKMAQTYFGVDTEYSGAVGLKRQRAVYPDAKKRFQEKRTQIGDEHAVIPPSQQQ